MPNHLVTQITYRLEKWRAVFTGILDTAASTFLLAIAVREFQAGALAKAFIASGFSLGLLCSPIVVSTVERACVPPAQAAAQVLAFGSLTFLITSLWKTEWVFVCGAALATASFAYIIPLLTQVYQENYPEETRGQLFAHTTVIRIVSGAIAGHLLGLLLTNHIIGFTLLLDTFALAMAISAFLVSKIPSKPLTPCGGGHPFKALRFIQQDRLFRRTLLGWMFLGFGNLMMVPLRVEYLANPKYSVKISGELLTIGAVALYTTVIPNIARVAVNPLWGYLFDRANFFVLRVALNIGFMVGIVTFFMSNSPLGLAIGSAAYGIALSGGDVAWGLWVTKFAPPDRVADYMAAHTFLTGVRGILAPIISFQLTHFLSIQIVSLIAAGLIFIGTVVFFTEIRAGSTSKKGTIVIEEISE